MGRSLFDAAGFERLEVAKVAKAVEVDDHAVPARGLVTGNPTILEINQRAAVGPEGVVTAAIVALENTFGPAPTKLDFQATIFVGHKPTC
jgi:hypothetical protein